MSQVKRFANSSEIMSREKNWVYPWRALRKKSCWRMISNVQWRHGIFSIHIRIVGGVELVFQRKARFDATSECPGGGSEFASSPHEISNPPMGRLEPARRRTNREEIVSKKTRGYRGGTEDLRRTGTHFPRTLRPASPKRIARYHRLQTRRTFP